MNASSIVDEANVLQDEARRRGLVLRLIGSLAISLRCAATRHLTEVLGRRPPRDIDFVGYSTQSLLLEHLFAERGYELHPAVRHSREWGIKRLIYNNQAGYKVDIFLDELVMAHTIPFTGRLEREPVTVSLADLLLSKLQIHRITENDLIDVVVLLAAASFGTGVGEIDLDYIVSLMSADWGFHRTTLENLQKLEEALGRYTLLEGGMRDTVRSRATQLASAMDAAPKTARWRLRARVGTRIPWYEHVDEVEM